MPSPAVRWPHLMPESPCGCSSRGRWALHVDAAVLSERRQRGQEHGRHGEHQTVRGVPDHHSSFARKLRDVRGGRTDREASASRDVAGSARTTGFETLDRHRGTPHQPPSVALRWSPRAVAGAGGTRANTPSGGQTAWIGKGRPQPGGSHQPNATLRAGPAGCGYGALHGASKTRSASEPLEGCQVSKVTSHS